MAKFPVQIGPGSIVDLILQTRLGLLAVNGQVAWADAPGTQMSHGIAFREPRGDDFALDLFHSENA